MFTIFFFKLIAKTEKFLSNEYRPFPLSFKKSICELMEEDWFGFGSMRAKYSNLTKCPIKPVNKLWFFIKYSRGLIVFFFQGFYVGTNIMPISNAFPPNVPQGKYKIVSTVYVSSTTIKSVIVETYLSVNYFV